MVEIDHTLEQFIDRISFQHAIVYFHNLKFDGRFILDWLFKNGYEHLADEDRDVPRGYFRTLISNMGRFYSLKVHFNKTAFHNGHVVEFRDSLNKIPLSVANTAKAFNQEETKGDIDYHKLRPVGYVMDEEERDYIRRDVSIMAHAMKEVHDSGMSRLTVASDALKEFKSLTGKRFQRLFPKLSSEMDTMIRKAYRGGFTYADPRFHKRKVGAGIVLDVNSLYPSVMKNKLIPYGEPLWVDGKVETTDNYPLSIFNVTFTAKLKPNHIPCIQIKNSSMFAPTAYLTEITEPTTLTMTNVDFALYQDHYDMTVLEWGGGWLFHASIGMFDDYINKWAKVKEESTGGKREIAKLHLNSLYGKFATNPQVTSKIPVLDGDTVKLVRGPDNERAPVYTAAGVFITSWARDLTVRAAQANYDVFAYADTDSLHLLGDHWEVGKDARGKDVLLNPPDGIDVHPTRMGAWKFEYAFDGAFYVRPKLYLEHLPDKESSCGDPECEIRHDYVARVAGLPERVSTKLTFDDLYDGNVFVGKMVPKAVPGGIVLTDIDYRLKF